MFTQKEQEHACFSVSVIATLQTGNENFLMCVSFPAQQSTPSMEQSSASAFLSEAPFPHLFNAAADTA